MPCWSHRSDTGVCSRRWSRSMATFSGALKRFRVFLDMGKPPLEIVAYSCALFFPFRLRQNKILGTEVSAQGYLAAQGPEAKEHHDRLIACWYGGLRDRVLAFAYELELEEQPDSTLESSPYTFELRL